MRPRSWLHLTGEGLSRNDASLVDSDVVVCLTLADECNGPHCDTQADNFTLKVERVM